MTIQEAYDKYRHLDRVLSVLGAPGCDNPIHACCADLWNAVKAQAETAAPAPAPEPAVTEPPSYVTDTLKHRTRHLNCATCGAGTSGRQWWNRDTGYGVCPSCFAAAVISEGAEAARSNFGLPGIHNCLPGPNTPPNCLISYPSTSPEGTPVIVDASIPLPEPVIIEEIAKIASAVVFSSPADRRHYRVDQEPAP